MPDWVLATWLASRNAPVCYDDRRRRSPQAPIAEGVDRAGVGIVAMNTALAARHEFAIELAGEAGVLAATLRRSLGALEAKDPMDYATEADHAVEALIRKRIGGRFGDPVIGEEDGGEPADLVWVVDPIDGTVNYIHGSRRWCVSIALVEGGDIVSGVINAPDENRLFSAQRGHGALLNGTPARVSNLRHGASPVVELGWSPRRPIGAYGSLIQRLIADGIEFRRLGSGALGVADTAAGLNDGYIELHINAWDVLAGIILVREAGGWTSDFLAGNGLVTGNPVTVCTPEISARLRAAIQLPGL
jgi:myo-inositol-1(or 4)-monophosphatase